MKKILAVLIGLSLGGAFFATSTFAANKTSRFRGSTRYYQNVEAYSQTQKQSRLPRYSSRSRTTTTNWTLLQQRSTESKSDSTTTKRTVSSRLRGGAFAATGGQTAVTQSVRSVKEEFNTFSAENIAFKIDLPLGFEKISDTLSWSSGEMLFRNGDAEITLTATNNRCDGGVTFMRSCLQGKSDDALQAFKMKLPKMVLRENKNISLDESLLQLEKKNMGRYVDLYTREYGAGQLTFFDPTNEFVWILQIIDPNNKTQLLANNRDLSKIFSSLTQKSVVSSKTSRTILNTLFGSRNTNVGKSTMTKAPSVLGSDQMQTFVAENVAFHIELPVGFELLSDTIEKNTGEMSFQKGEELLEVTATESICNDQTPRLLQRCIEERAQEFATALQAEFPKANILQDENMQVQLEDVSSFAQNFRQSSAFKRQIGRISIFRDTGKRMGYFVFPEPTEGYIWAIRMEAPENKDAFLNDVRQKRKILNSLFFETEK